MSILSDEELLRLRKRADLMLLSSPAQYNLVEELTNQIVARDLMTEVKPPTL